MPKFIHQNVFDNGLQYIITRVAANTVDLLLISTYQLGQAYSTVNANKLATIDLVSADVSLAANGTYGRQLAVVAKSGTASAASGTPHDLHVAIVDTNLSLVLAVTDETSEQDITIGRAINLPAFAVRMNQPP